MSTLPAPAIAMKLAQRLHARSEGDTNFWDFAASPARSGNHALFQYPAMMVPELQGALLDDAICEDPTIKRVYDPFTGSGTVLLESLYRGLDFQGGDINPMAVLLSWVKGTPPHADEAKRAAEATAIRAINYPKAKQLTFHNRDKWFNPEVVEGLSRLRIAIQAEPDLTTRRFLWICLAETIRLVSNSRISTFKLHVYSAEQMKTRKPDAIRVFSAVGLANSQRVGDHWTRLRTSERTSAIVLASGSVYDPWEATGEADLVMTSPPYGDNKTTVPYGQHSFLALQWIDHDDLIGEFNPTHLSTTARIDSLSLGGSIVGADLSRPILESKSANLAEFLLKIESKAPLRKKVLAFTRDYAAALETISNRLRPAGLSFWTLGERRVGGYEMPLVAITREILLADGHTEVATLNRTLPLKRKRMAGRNDQVATIATEQILVMQRGSAK